MKATLSRVFNPQQKDDFLYDDVMYYVIDFMPTVTFGKLATMYINVHMYKQYPVELHTYITWC